MSLGNVEVFMHRAKRLGSRGTYRTQQPQGREPKRAAGTFSKSKRLSQTEKMIKRIPDEVKASVLRGLLSC